MNVIPVALEGLIGILKPPNLGNLEVEKLAVWTVEEVSCTACCWNCPSVAPIYAWYILHSLTFIFKLFYSEKKKKAFALIFILFYPI